MLKEKKSQRYRCKFITQTVMAFLECLKPKHSPSSSDMAKDEARNEKEEDASSNKTTARSLNLARKRKSKPMASSGKRGGVNTYDM
ncbi:unnamed protein product [Eruca vesicaria subsp. sativa]|uniref:Uncharacterized protein n=1 Tax=Eruca vesicaria subsp. sativa TaxID=29727 RepID=A0ABC8ILF9_ERUVS|nr:unnamed protein product [Eruca vesicaria subsp. sativa]